MGNRAVITTKKNLKNNGVGIYVHWNGGPDSVGNFLKYCELKQYREPTADDYGWACLAGVITNFFGDGLSCGVDQINNLDCDNGDNGVWIIDGWKVTGRVYGPASEIVINPEFVAAINEIMPERMKLDAETLASVQAETYSVPELDAPEPEPPKGPAATYTRNEEKNGIEIKFESCPDKETREQLKAAGYRWHNKLKIWYAKYSAATYELAETLATWTEPEAADAAPEPEQLEITPKARPSEHTLT